MSPWRNQRVWSLQREVTCWSSNQVSAVFLDCLGAMTEKSCDLLSLTGVGLTRTTVATLLSKHSRYFNVFRRLIAGQKQ